MKAFEEWIKKTKFQEQYCFECGGISKEDLEPVWKAALEWALEEGCCEGDGGMDYASKELQKKYPKAYIEYIEANRLRKELEEE